VRILVTAGPTREHIDSVRYLSNASTGRMGFAIAAAAHDRGHDVTLVHGPVSQAAPDSVRVVPVISAADMLEACRACWGSHDALIMTAAVADYTPASPLDRKLKKSPRRLTLRLKPTVDILAALASQRRDDQIAIGFALEDRAHRRNAESKLRRKKLDAIVLNRPANIGSDRAAMEVLVRGGCWATWASAPKRRVAERLVKLAERLAK
jgi:phosphopantothenoylcysteine decarboxylase/phosphopantothenate--cysteine ligase